MEPTFGLGQPNDAFAQYFSGKSYLNMLTDMEKVKLGAFNVTFEPGCRNNWHIHHTKTGGGQVLICVDGEGWYQEYGKEPQSLKAGDVGMPFFHYIVIDIVIPLRGIIIDNVIDALNSHEHRS